MRSSLLAAALLVLPFAAAAQDGRSLVATCANCHGTGGRSVTTEVTSLAGMPKEQIAQRMREFRDGKRPATIMHQLAKGYTDRQIDLIADTLGRQR